MATSGDCSKDSCFQDVLHYEPSLAGNATLLALFALLVPLAFIVGIKYHSSVFSTTITTGLFLEIVGYVGRVLLARNDDGYKVDFILGYVGTLVAPTFISLAIFRLMPPIVAAYGDDFKTWRPNWHNIVFYVFTVICVALQAAGGVLTTLPIDSNLVSLYISNVSKWLLIVCQQVNIGVRLSVTGLAIQVSSLLIFVFLAFRFAYAVHERRTRLDTSSLVVYNTRRFNVFIIGMQPSQCIPAHNVTC
jgi:hypothetical protein